MSGPGQDDPGTAPLPGLVLELGRDGTIFRYDGHGLDAFALVAESVGQRIQGLMPDAYTRVTMGDVERALETGRSVFMLHTVGTPPRQRTFETTTIPIGPDRVVRVVEEITRQVEWWERLQISEARFRQLFEQAVDGIFVFDEQGRIVDANPRAHAAAGVDHDGLLAASMSDLFPEPGPARLLKLSRGLRPPETATLAAIQRRQDGSTFPVELRLARMAVEGPPRYVAVVRDVSDRRTVERVALDAAEEEQRRIGRDLHDGLGQHLAGLGFMAKALERSLSSAGRPEAEAAAEIRRLVEQALGHSRALAHGLAPVDVHGTELIPALEGLAHDTASLCGIECVFEVRGQPRIRDEVTATALYRIAQEAVTNALRHAEASKMWIRLAESEDGVELVVKDDGRGLAREESTVRRGRGLGHRLMAMRAERIGGILDMTSRPGRGTTVRCLVGRTTPSAPVRVAVPRDAGV
jgi:two-component system sensor kinase FixL